MTPSLRDKISVFNPELALEQARTIPADWYIDADVYALERRAVFGDAWLVAGRAADVAESGSYLTTEIAGEPIVVVRDEAGVLRAFSNVCRHRASPVATAACGKASRLRCRYHGWTYDLAGRLRGAPEFEGVADFRREDNGLPPLAVAVWGPWVWVHAGDRPSELLEFLAPLPARAPAATLEGLQFVGRREYDVACNWKVYVDNYLDGGYHVHTIHPALAGVLDYVHYRTEVHGWNSVQISPLKAAGGADDTARTRTGDAAQYWWIYPNFMVNLYQGVMDTNLVLPLGPDHCRVVFDFCFAETEGKKAEAFRRDSMAVADRIQQEDMQICEQVQRGLQSRSYRTGRFSVRRENGGYHFHQLLGRRLRAALPS
ncbi:MAG TPA: SRPBCC family protein [Gemmataceae bacterium]|nr:SRPBCC family protein [Gemmataceae bacterium]